MRRWAVSSWPCRSFSGETLAVRDGRLPRNPATGVRLPRAAKGEPVFLTHTQVERLAEACIDHELFVRVLAYTGMRWGEATAVRVRRLHLMKRRIEVVHTAVELNGEITYGGPTPAALGAVPPALVDARPSTSATSCPTSWCSRPRAAT